MCGRFSEAASAKKIAEIFRIDERIVPPKQNRFNITPGQPVLTLMNDFGKKRFDYLNWGLIPTWSKSITTHTPMINARAETIFEKPSFRGLVRNSRCLVMADGFYEWKKTASGKQPYYIRMKSGDPFGFAGIHTSWTSQDGSEIYSCAVVTTSPNTSMQSIHARMPVMLTEHSADIWLDKNITQVNRIKPLMNAISDDKIEIFPVSSYVNTPNHDSERCREKSEMLSTDQTDMLF